MVAHPTITESDYRRELYGRMATEAALVRQNRPATRNQIESLEEFADRIGIDVYVGEYLTSEQASLELATLIRVLHRMESIRQECAG